MHPSSKIVLPFWLALLAAGTVVRIFAAQGELWFDEIWSLMQTRGLSSLLDVLKIRQDNRHPLTSLWLYFIPIDAPQLLFRLPSLACSFLTASLFGTFLIKGKPEHMPAYAIWMFLVESSYLFTLYDSEARGYAGLVTTSLALFLLKDHLAHQWSFSKAATFGTIVLLGILSHPVFLLVVLPYLAWSWLAWSWRTSSQRAADWRSLRDRIAISAGILIGVGLPVYNNMQIGGAPVLPFIQVAASTLVLSIGGESISMYRPELAAWWLVAALVVVTVATIEFRLWLRESCSDALLVLLLIVTPLIVVILTQPQFVLPRYFIVSVLFMYYVVARFLARLFRQGVLGGAVCIMGLLAYLLTNGHHSAQLIAGGRSQYVATLRHIAALNPLARIGGNQDFQSSIRFPYVNAVASTTNRLRYTVQGTENLTQLDYVILETVDREEPLPDQLGDKEQGVFRRMSLWRAPAESGANLALYERSPPLGGPLFLDASAR